MGRRTSPSSPPDSDADARKASGGDATPPHPRPAVRCPHCGAADVELVAAFGGSLMSRQYYCRGCRTVFEWVKWESDDPSEWLR